MVLSVRSRDSNHGTSKISPKSSCSLRNNGVSGALRRPSGLCGDAGQLIDKSVADGPRGRQSHSLKIGVLTEQTGVRHGWADGIAEAVHGILQPRQGNVVPLEHPAVHDPSAEERQPLRERRFARELRGGEGVIIEGEYVREEVGDGGHERDGRLGREVEAVAELDRLDGDFLREIVGDVVGGGCQRAE